MQDTTPKLRLSPSKLITFNDCPRKYAHDTSDGYVSSDNIYGLVGTAAHHVLELLNKGAELTADEREAEMKRKLIELCAEKNVSLDFPKGYKESKVHVRDYEHPVDLRILTTEHKHVLEFDNFVVSYIIDVEYESLDGTELHIRDYKTNASVPKSPLQLMLYAALETERYAREGRLFEKVYAGFHMLRTGKITEAHINEEQIAITTRWIHEQAQKIQKFKAKNSFPAIPGNCFFCTDHDCPERV